MSNYTMSRHRARPHSTHILLVKFIILALHALNDVVSIYVWISPMVQQDSICKSNLNLRRIFIITCNQLWSSVRTAIKGIPIFICFKIFHVVLKLDKYACNVSGITYGAIAFVSRCEREISIPDMRFKCWSYRKSQLTHVGHFVKIIDCGCIEYCVQIAAPGLKIIFHNTIKYCFLACVDSKRITLSILDIISVIITFHGSHKYVLISVVYGIWQRIIIHLL